MFHVEHPSCFVDTLLDSAPTFGLSIDQYHISQLTIYYRELKIWNEKINLTAIREEKAIAVKHFLDSLACAKILTLSHGTTLLDVGTGAGFPGLPLKILHPRLDLTLLEPNQKKTAFLRHVIGTLGLNHATVVSKQMQELGRELEQGCRFAYVITRAVNQAQILSAARPLLKSHGRLILCRVESLGSDQNLFGLQVVDELSYNLPYGYGRRVLTVLEPMTA